MTLLGPLPLEFEAGLLGVSPLLAVVAKQGGVTLRRSLKTIRVAMRSSSGGWKRLGLGAGLKEKSRGMGWLLETIVFNPSTADSFFEGEGILSMNELASK